MLRLLFSVMLFAFFISVPVVAQEHNHAPGHCPWCENGLSHGDALDVDEEWRPTTRPKETDTTTLLITLLAVILLLIGSLQWAKRERG